MYGVIYFGVYVCLQVLCEGGVWLGLVINKELCYVWCVFDVNDFIGYFEQVIGGDLLVWKKFDVWVLQYVMVMLYCEFVYIVYLGDLVIDLYVVCYVGVVDWVVFWGYNVGQLVEYDWLSWMFYSLLQVVEYVFLLCQGLNVLEIVVVCVIGWFG